MKTCKKCKRQFKGYIKVNGKTRNLKNRQYCFNCSPFGKHNTVKLETHVNKQETACVCSNCSRVYTYVRKKGLTTKMCNSCMTKRRRTRIKEQLIQLKGGKCERCDYCKNLAALNFHHNSEMTKSFGISDRLNRSLASSLEEVKKCILLCANCHAELHNPQLTRV